ncbi:MAG: phage head closure protein [Clostridiales bacterium]|jgi:SPP1 family predicted phage head-tail adaptor|nr:phage head closure protein [Clostridiales bacterium]
MKVGRMRYRIEIEDLIKITDNDGFVSEEWIPFAEVWADITPVSGREYFDSAQDLSEVTSKIYIRYLRGLKTIMRIKCVERVFNIQSILHDERQGITTIIAKEVL